MRFAARLTLAVLATAAMCACGGSPSETPGPATPSTIQTARVPTPTADPYAVYLANNPDPELILSREDAQTRALLGCGQPWAPGTIDAVLADSYAALCKSVRTP